MFGSSRAARAMPRFLCCGPDFRPSEALRAAYGRRVLCPDFATSDLPLDWSLAAAILLLIVREIVSHHDKRVQGQPNSDLPRVLRSTVLLLGARFISAEVPPRVAAGNLLQASTTFKMSEDDAASS
jgi:hypothetical protein